MSETQHSSQGEAGSLKTEKVFWTYADLSEHSGRPVSSLQKYLHWGLFRAGKEYLKFGTRVEFNPVKAMERLRWIGANPDVLRQAKKDVESAVDERRRKALKIVSDREGGGALPGPAQSGDRGYDPHRADKPDV